MRTADVVAREIWWAIEKRTTENGEEDRDLNDGVGDVIIAEVRKYQQEISRAIHSLDIGDVIGRDGEYVADHLFKLTDQLK